MVVNDARSERYMDMCICMCMRNAHVVHIMCMCIPDEYDQRDVLDLLCQLISSNWTDGPFTVAFRKLAGEGNAQGRAIHNQPAWLVS